MTIATEAGLEKWARKYAADRGVLNYKFTSTAQCGVPDVIFFWDGRAFLVEFKAPNGKGRLSALQKRQIDKLRAAGIPVYVVDKQSYFVEVLESFKAAVLLRQTNTTSFKQGKTNEKTE